MPVETAIEPVQTKLAVRRWRPRFSLLTLLLSVLTLASAATLWWNRGAWQLSYVIDDKAPIRDAGITPDGKYVFTLLDKAPVNGDQTAPQDVGMAPWLRGSSEVMLRDAASGAVRFSFHSKEPGQRVFCSPKGEWVVLYRWSGLSCADYFIKVWSARDGREVARPKDFPHGFIAFSARDDYAAGFESLNRDEAAIVSLPEWKVVRKDVEFRGFAHNTAAFLCAENDPEHSVSAKGFVNLVALSAGETLQRWPVDGYAQEAALSADDKLVAASIQQPSGDYRVAVFDAATRREVASTHGYLAGNFLGTTFSSDGTKLPIGSDTGGAVWLWDFAADTTSPLTGHEEQTSDVRVHVLRSETAPVNSARDGAPLIDLSDLRWRARVNFPIRAVQFNADETCCVCYAAPDWYSKLPLDSHAAVFRKVRPDGSGGLLWMPEFWMTLVLAGAFFWSAIRKR
ncbi:MAG TPA: WD40 repeat domain-containing protein [Planctomycetota bacterium]|nr:WD40 repeat domain-containing protein [Planctomycetota bacterium]